MKFIINWVRSWFISKSENPGDENLEPKAPLEPSKPLEPVDDGYEINQACIDLICEFEGFYSKPYLDPVGIPTIGYGTIIYQNGKKVSLKDEPITKEKAQEYLRYELKEKASKISKFLRSINLELNANEFGALLSLAYNCGEGVITQSHRSMHKALKSHDKQEILNAFDLYTTAKMIRLPGLVRRRKAEKVLFLLK